MDSHLKLVADTPEDPSAQRIAVEPPPTTVRPVGPKYVYEDPRYEVTLEFSHVKRGDDPSATVYVHHPCSLDGSALKATRLNLLGSAKKRELAKDLAISAAVVPVWPEIIERACQAMMAELATVHPREARTLSGALHYRADRIRGFLRNDSLNLLYGSGGVGKGWLAIYAAMCVHQGQPWAGRPTLQGNVLYLDWEDDAETFDLRVQIVANGTGLAPVAPYYYEMTGPLPDRIDGLLTYINQHRIELVIIDSVSKAFPRGEYSSYETTADELAAMARLFPTTLAIDHVTGSAVDSDKLAGKPIGGIGKVNAARTQWETRGTQEGLRLWAGLYQTKRNHTAKLAPLGFSMEFDDPEHPTRVRIEAADVSTVPELARHDSLSTRLDELLTHGRYTYAEMFEELEITDQKTRNVARSTVARLVKQGVYRREGLGKGAVYWKPTVRGIA